MGRCHGITLLPILIRDHRDFPTRLPLARIVADDKSRARTCPCHQLYRNKYRASLESVNSIHQPERQLQQREDILHDRQYGQPEAMEQFNESEIGKWI